MTASKENDFAGESDEGERISEYAPTVSAAESRIQKTARTKMAMAANPSGSKNGTAMPVTNEYEIEIKAYGTTTSHILVLADENPASSRPSGHLSPTCMEKKRNDKPPDDTDGKKFAKKESKW